MEFVKPQKFRARVSEKYYLTENNKFLYVKFELIAPDRISFQAGQYMSFALDSLGLRRSYSMATSPDTDHGFSIVAEMIAGGKGSEFLKNITVGGEAEVLGPLGRFVVEENQSTKESKNQSKLLFVATGSGIVPIYSMINDLLINKHETRQMRLHWGLHDKSDMFWFDNFERLMENYPNFVFDPVLSSPGQEWSLCVGHVQDCLRRDFSAQGGEGLKDWQGYVCGSPTMVKEVSEVLSSLGMKNESIFHEKFV